MIFIVAYSDISKVGYKLINGRIEYLQLVFVVDKEDRHFGANIKNEVYEVSSALCNVSSIIDPNIMYSLMCDMVDVGSFNSSIGQDNVLTVKYLQDDLTITT